MSATLPLPIEVTRPSNVPLHVLTLTPFYPEVNDDAQGCFVSEPLPWLEALGVRNTVVAVRPFYHEKASSNPSAPLATWHPYFSLPSGRGLPTAGTFLYRSLLKQVRSLHRASPLQLIHAHAPLPCGHAAALLARELGISFVVTVHGKDVFSTRQVKGYAGRWCKRVTENVLAAASRVVCVSEKVRQEVAQGSTAKTSVVYNGVDPLLFVPAGDEARTDVLLSVGNLIPVKGHEALVQAFARIHQRFPELSLEIIGDGPERGRLIALSKRLDIAAKLRLPGRKSRAEVPQAMKGCSVFALPSRYEGLGCVYLEAMSAARPVIACRGQGIDEVILHDRNGLLVEPGDVAGLADALIALLDDRDRAKQLGKAARRTILEGYTLAHQADRLLGVYRECLA